jgi:hypothetical protein
LGGGCDETGTANPPRTDIVAVQIDPAGANLQLDTAPRPLRAKALDAANQELSNRSFAWSSSNPAVASISGGFNGMGNPMNVIANSPGFATITATSEGISGTCVIMVETPAEPATQLTGRVVDAVTSNGIAAATVFFDVNDPSRRLGTATTDADGKYLSPPLLLASDRRIDVAALATGYVSATLYLVPPTPGVTTTIQPLPLVPNASGVGAILGHVLNARTNDGIANARVELFPGLRTYGSLMSTQSGADGAFAFRNLMPGTYTINCDQVTGFAANTRTGIAVGNNTETPNQDLVLSPTGSEEIRIVLTWGVDPSDLDSHLTGQNPSPDPNRFHIFYSNRGDANASPFAVLDVDDTQSEGPETITIARFSGGTYRYSVHDYTNRQSASSTGLGNSGARVDVYCPHCPTYHTTFVVPNERGTLWTVFELEGSLANTTLIPRNDMGIASDPDAIPKAGVSGHESDAERIGRDVQEHRKDSR